MRFCLPGCHFGYRCSGDGKARLVILDLGIPAGDGFVVMERLHKNDHLGNIPVLVLTGRGLADNRDRALKAGATAFFQKPVEDSTLLFAIRKALGVSRGQLPFDD